ncbi:hypothetical protein GSY74_08455, partial [Sulfurovum sp. bin170]|uniref:hypothetical protein n=1 Tax=Sulfurovum sp. bin170 TaxID=2695268 RepID=UPI0013E0927C
FVTNKKRATTTFLKSMIERKSSCYIVYPLFGFNGNLLVNREEAINSINLNIEVAQRGVKIYRIFIVDSLDDVDSFVIKTVKRMEEVGVDIRFAIKKDIETLVTSYDFAFPVEKDVVLHKERSEKNNDFSINPDEGTIMIYVNNYRLIKEKSLKLDKVLELKNQRSHEAYIPKENFLFSQDNRVLQKLLKDDGLWYFYSYPSNNNMEEKVWIIQTQFFENFTLIDAYRNKGQLFIGTNQSIVIKEGDNSKNMTAILFDNSKISYDILPFARISKSNGAEEQIFNFGFFSRKEFSEDEAVEILGDIDKLQLKIDYSFVQRVNGWIGKSS